MRMLSSTSLEQLIAKKRRLKQGAMQELLTGKKRLPGFNGEWKQMRHWEMIPEVRVRDNLKALRTANWRFATYISIAEIVRCWNIKHLLRVRYFESRHPMCDAPPKVRRG